MSLREEITTIIDEMYEEYNTERISEEIISKFEKRIDEKIRIDREVVTNLLKQKQDLESKPLIRLTSRIDGYIGIKEMLK
ncbi:MAG: hypothetical protein K0S93_184 [Nitrososphaeraceae archaeon]|jgi:hypothetical protein|nr:hypothetical protein [Nitrososphaeraceae archaeon]